MSAQRDMWRDPVTAPTVPDGSPFTMRDYQRRAVEGVLTRWQEGTRGVLAVLATGCGKTVIATEVIRARSLTGQRTLFLAHRTELLTQAAAKLRRCGLRCDTEKAEQYASVTSLSPSHVVVASVQTLRSRRLERWPRDAFGTIVVDEAHHATANGYRAILDHFESADVLGLTATPDRSDEVALGHVFDEVAIRYGIREAISDGYLVPIRAQSIGGLDLSAVRTVAGDLNQGDLEAAVGAEPTLYACAQALEENTQGRATLVFTPGVESAHRLAGILGQLDGVGPDAVASLDGKTGDDARAQMLARFAAGELRYLVNCAVLTEGFDAPVASCVAMLRPTKSRSLYTQCVGRGTRPLPGVVDGPATAEERRAAIAASGKPDMLLLDFTDRERVDLVGPLDVLSGKPLPEEMRAAMREELETAEARTLEDVLEAAATWERQAEERRATERRRARIQVHARYCTSELMLDRMGDAHVAAWSAAVQNARAARDGCPRGATDKQRSYLERYGVQLPKSATVKQASAAIEAIKAAKVCTLGQGATLRKHGLPADVSFETARTLLDGLARHGWQTVPAMFPWAEARRLKPEGAE